MVSFDYSSDSSDEIREWRLQELRDEVYSIEDATPDGVNREGEERYMTWNYSGNAKICICGNDAPQYTCWFPGKHFGRRYYGCKNWCNRKRAYLYCVYFEWKDPPMDGRSLEVISELNDEIMSLRESKSSPGVTLEAPSGSNNSSTVSCTAFCVGIWLGIVACVIFKFLF